MISLPQPFTSVTVAESCIWVVVFSFRRIALPLLRVTELTTGATLFTVKSDSEPCFVPEASKLNWSTTKTHASYKPSEVGVGIVYEQLGFEAERELVHQFPPVQVPDEIAFVLQTRSLTVLPSGSEAVAFHWIDSVGFCEESVIFMSVNVGEWLT